MPNLPGYSRDDLAKPPTKRELAQEEREWRALGLWVKTLNLSEVRKAMKLPTNAAANILIKRAARRYSEQRAEHAEQAYFMQSQLLMMSFRDLAERIFEKGEAGRYGDLKAMMDMAGKLHGTFAQVEEVTTGNTYVLAAGGDINLVPKGAETFDVRRPWERPELLEGEVVE